MLSVEKFVLVESDLNLKRDIHFIILFNDISNLLVKSRFAIRLSLKSSNVRFSHSMTFIFRLRVSLFTREGVCAKEEEKQKY